MYTNKSSVNKAANTVTSLPAGENIKHLGLIIFIKKKEVSAHLSESKDFFFASELYKDAKNVIDNDLLHGLPTPPSKSFSQYVHDYDGGLLSQREISETMNSIPNDSTPVKRDGVTFQQYMSTGTRTFDDECSSSKYIPTSIRNKVLYFYRLHRYTDVLGALNIDVNATGTDSTISKRVVSNAARTKKFKPSEDIPCSSGMVPASDDTDGNTSMPSVSEDTASSSAFVQLQEETTPFSRFAQNLISESGCLQWRIHSLDLDVLVMNDVDLGRGTFHANKFVHIWRWKCAQGDILYECNCYMHNVVGTMDTDSSCCHVRFMRELVDPLYPFIFDDSTDLVQTHLWRKLCQAKEALNIPVVRLDSHDTFHRFSVLSRNMRACSVVTLQSNRFLCLNGKCGALHGHTRKVKDIDSGSSCEHLQQVNEHKEQWKQIVEGRIDDDDDDEIDDGNDDAMSGMRETVESDQAPRPSTDFFNPNTGLYTFHRNSVGDHKPKQQHDPYLFRCKVERQQITSSDRFYDYFPTLDTDKVCHCGNKYFDKNHPDGIVTRRYAMHTSLYTEVGVVKMWICDRQCLNKKQECVVKYSG